MHTHMQNLLVHCRAKRETIVTIAHVNSKNDVALLSYARALKLTAGWVRTHDTFVNNLAL